MTSMIHRSIMRLALLALASLGVGCSGEPAAGACCDDAPAATGPLPETSVYQLRAPWQDHTGATVKLADFRGNVALVAMIFTRCAYACPMTIGDLKTIAQQLGDQATDVRVLLLSMDPERDDPEVMARWARTHQLGDNWRVLRSDADAVREVAAVLGVNYRQTPSGDFSHSNLITVLDADGVIVHRQEGLQASPKPTVSAVQQALARHTAQLSSRQR